MILTRGHTEGPQPEPAGTGLLLIHHHIGRAPAMMNRVGHGLRPRMAFTPFRVDVERSCTGEGGRIGHPIGAGAARHDHHRIGHHRPIGLIREFDLRIE